MTHTSARPTRREWSGKIIWRDPRAIDRPRRSFTATVELWSTLSWRDHKKIQPFHELDIFENREKQIQYLPYVSIIHKIQSINIYRLHAQSWWDFFFRIYWFSIIYILFVNTDTWTIILSIPSEKFRFSWMSKKSVTDVQSVFKRSPGYHDDIAVFACRWNLVDDRPVCIAPVSTKSKHRVVHETFDTDTISFHVVLTPGTL